jgi:hypothetical protein
MSREAGVAHATANLRRGSHSTGVAGFLEEDKWISQPATGDG